MPASSKHSTKFEAASSCGIVKPTTSNDASGNADSMENSGTPAARIASIMSSHGRYARSHAMPGWAFRMA